MELYLVVVLIVTVIVCYSTYKCVELVYPNAREVARLSKEVEALQTRLTDIDVNTLLDLQEEVKQIRNYQSLQYRR